MAGDYYGDEGSDEAGPSEAGEGMEGGDKSMGSDTGMGAETTLVPKSMFGDQEIEVGAEYYFKVERLLENEVEISYSKGDKEKEHTEGETDSPEGAFDGAFKMMNAS